MRGDVRVREWLPSMLVVVLAGVGCALSEPPPPTLPPLDSQCDSTDGAQFRCWLLDDYHP